MRNLAMSLFIVLIACAACAADDARLDKPITLSVKGEALADILPLIEKQTGVRLKVAYDIADQKATIFVDDKPLKEIMAGLKTVFQYTWSYTDFKGERRYSLSMPIKLRRQRDNWRKQAIDKAWPEFEAEVKRLADRPVKTREELDKMFEQTEFTAERTIPPVYLVSNFDWERREKAVAHLYQTLSSDLVKALRDGMTICWSLDSPEPEWKIPAALQEEFREGTIYYHVELNFPETRTKKDYGTLNVELSVPSSSDKFVVEVLERVGKAPDTTGYGGKIYEKSLRRIVPFPKNSLPRKAVPDGEVSFTEKELEDEAGLPKSPQPWRNEIYVNRSDLLALFHKKLGLQIISDHYSHWYSWQAADKCPVKGFLESFERFPGARPGELKPLGEFPGGRPGELKPLDEPDVPEHYTNYLAEQHPAADWGWDGRLLYMRTMDPVRMDSREIPNRTLRRWQAASGAGSLGLNEMAEMGVLPKDQRDMLEINHDRLGIEVGRGGIGLDPAIRFYGLLSPSQRQLMLDGRLGTQAFNAEQRSALLALVPRAMNPEGRKGSRVGIYDKAGRRVDKPDAAASEVYPEFVRLAIKSQEEWYATEDRQVAKTLDAALKELEDWERPLLRKFVHTTYEMTLIYADGAETTRHMLIYTCTSWRLPAEPEKPSN
ncbi:MAG TPA: hypothetical protein VFI02_13715 [Armatimonadota bacterium]|nr:hypothetical protein [Armatimonadota bacterium]